MLKDNLVRDGVNLVFENTFGDNNLFLDVNTKRIGINTDALSRELIINDSAKTTNLIVDSLALIDLLEINGSNNTITNSVSDVILGTGDTSVFVPRLENNDLIFDDNYILTKVSNTSIELRPVGTGNVTFNSNLDVFGNFHTVGDITLGGNITFGNADTDSVTFNTDVSTNLVPDETDVYNLGSVDKQWLELRTKLVNGSFLVAGDFAVEGVSNIALRPGNVWFVATNGTDTNEGDHENGPFGSIKHALSVAQSGDSITIYPGNYEEDFPLIVPQGVSVNGSGIRAVTVRPTESTKDQDAFVLNGETTVSDLTVKGYVYNSVNDTGYGFRFDENFEVTSRSPYIQNITIITEPNELYPAGRGALVDGSVATSISKEASMLFHSMTMIIPNSIGVYMTNGVRVEWLNSFTYFASKGLYATNGSLGRFDGTTTKYGAELRSIGSANVYGTVGAEVDGDQTLMYLINHNFAYIGTGVEPLNDRTATIQDNEAVTLNNGKIYWQSLDQQGDYRVGEAFVVDQKTGFVTLNGLGQGPGGVSNITLSDGTSVTELTTLKVETGNIRFSENTISSTDGPIIIDSFTSNIDLNQDVAISQDLGVSGNVVIKGTATIGDGIIDRVAFVADISSDIIPTSDNLYNLGSDLLQWNNLFVKDVLLLNVNINDNKIFTTSSSSDLQLGAAGTASVSFISDVVISNDLTVNGTTNLNDTEILGTLIHTGTTNQTGNSVFAGNFDLIGQLNLNNSTVSFDNIQISENRILTTNSNSDLELLAAGTGIIQVPKNNVVVENNLTVSTINSTDVIVVDQITAGSVFNENIKIQGNLIETTLSNSDLELNAAGSASIVLKSDTEIETNLLVQSSASFIRPSALDNAIAINAELEIENTANQPITQVGNRDQTGNFILDGQLVNDAVSSAYFENIVIENNTVGTADSNSDFELRAAGIGTVRIPNNTILSKNLTVTDTFYLNNVTADRIIGNLLSNDNIVVSGNVIRTTVSNSNLELRANGSGIISIPSNDAEISSDLTVLGTVVVKDTNLATVSHVGSLTRSGTSQQTGIYSIIGNLSANSEARFDNINFVGNRVATTQSQSDIDFRAAGTGSVVFNEELIITESLFVGDTLSANSMAVQTTVDADSLFNEVIRIKDNFITTVDSNTNLKLVGNNTGGVLVETTLFRNNTVAPVTANTNINLNLINSNVLINGSAAVKLPAGTTAQRPVGVIGDLRLNTSNGLFEGWNVGRKPLSGVYSTNLQTSIRASDTSNTINFVADGIAAMEVTTAGIRTNGLRIDSNLLIDGNNVSTVSNADINITPNGTGIVVLGSTTVTGNEFLNLSTTQPMSFAHTGFGYLKFNSTTGVVLPVGDSSNRPTSPEVGDLRFNTDLSIPEVFNGIAYSTLAGDSVTATIEQIQELNEIYAILLG